MADKNALTNIRNELLTREKELNDKIEKEKIRASEEEYSTELSDYDNHPGDSGSELYEREKDYALAAHERAELDSIQKALERMDNNEYGTCSVCGEEISIERLMAVPATQYCYEHAEKNIETNEEEQQSMGSVENDDTDSWKTLERYGSSASPSDVTGDHDSYDNLTENSDSENPDGMDRFSNDDKISD